MNCLVSIAAIVLAGPFMVGSSAGTTKPKAMTNVNPAARSVSTPSEAAFSPGETRSR